MAFEDGTNVNRGITVGRARIRDECLEYAGWTANGQQTPRLRRRARETVRRTTGMTSISPGPSERHSPAA